MLECGPALPLTRGYIMKTLPESIDQDKIQEVMNYLDESFPDNSFGHGYDFDRIAETFIISLEKHNRLVTISREFFDDHPVDQIVPVLKTHNIAAILKSMKYHRIVVTNAGINYEEA
jgi:hypothetical protein